MVQETITIESVDVIFDKCPGSRFYRGDMNGKNVKVVEKHKKYEDIFRRLCQHCNVCTYTGMGFDKDDNCYFVFESGTSLSNILDSSPGKLPNSTLKCISTDLVNGASHFKKQGYGFYKLAFEDVLMIWSGTGWNAKLANVENLGNIFDMSSDALGSMLKKIPTQVSAEYTDLLQRANIRPSAFIDTEQPFYWHQEKILMFYHNVNEVMKTDNNLFEEFNNIKDKNFPESWLVHIGDPSIMLAFGDTVGKKQKDAGNDMKLGFLVRAISNAHSQLPNYLIRNPVFKNRVTFGDWISKLFPNLFIHTYCFMEGKGMLKNLPL